MFKTKIKFQRKKRLTPSAIAEAFPDFRVKQTLKIAFAGIFTSIFAYYLHLRGAYFAVATVFLLMTSFHHEIFSRGIERLFGPLIASILALICVAVFYKSPFVYLLIIFLGSLVFFYCFAMGLYAYATLLGGITFTFVCVQGFIHDISFARTLAIEWIVGIFIAVVVGTLVNYFIWPMPASRAVPVAIARILKKRAKALGIAFEHLLTPENKSMKRAISFSALDLSRVLQLIDSAKKERVLQGSKFQSYLDLCGIIRSFSLKIKGFYLLTDSGEGKLFLENFEGIFTKIRYELHEVMAQLMNGLRSKRMSPIDFTLLNDAQKSMNQQIEELRVTHRTREFPIESVLKFYGIINQINLIIRDVEVIYHYLEDLKQKEVIFQKSALPSLLQWKPDIVKVALRASIAVSAIFLINYFLNWDEVSVPAIVTAGMIVSQANLGRSHHRGRLRILGVIVGGLYGFICLFILHKFPNFLLVEILLFIGFLLFAFIGLGDERFAFGGLQAGVMACFILVADYGEIGNYTHGIARLVGFVEGAVISLVLLQILWPAHPFRMIKEKLNEIILGCGRLLTVIIDLSHKENLAKTGILKRMIEKRLIENATLANDARFLFYGQKEYISQVRAISECFDRILAELESLEVAVIDAMHGNLVVLFLKSIQNNLQDIQEFFSKLSEFLQDPNSANHFNVEFELHEIQKQMQLIREQRIATAFPTADVTQYATAAVSLQQLLISLTDLRKHLKILGAPPSLSA